VVRTGRIGFPSIGIVPQLQNSRAVWESEMVVLVSLVSVWGRNWCYLCGRVERVAKCEIIEIAFVHADSLHLTEDMI